MYQIHILSSLVFHLPLQQLVSLPSWLILVVIIIMVVSPSSLSFHDHDVPSSFLIFHVRVHVHGRVHDDDDVLRITKLGKEFWHILFFRITESNIINTSKNAGNSDTCLYHLTTFGTLALSYSPYKKVNIP